MYDAVYCHFDGYPEGDGSVGKTLQDFYLTEEKVRELIEGGAMSSLSQEVKDCEFYTKRGEELHNYKGLELDALRRIGIDIGCEYLYVFFRNEWCYITLT